MRVPQLAAVILAAGASSRMGRTKALLPLGPGGPSFLGHLVASMRAAGLQDILVVTASDAAAVEDEARRAAPGVATVRNPDPSRGQLSSLVTALDALDNFRDVLRTALAPPDAILVHPVDQPLVTSSTIAAIVEAWRRTRAPIVRPASGGRHGHPVLFGRALFAELRGADLARGARPIVQAHGDEAIDVEVDDEWAFLDIDTPEDYQAALARIKRDD